MQFEGFSPKTIEFLINLGLNNNKAWYQEHKKEYNEYLLIPFQSLVISLKDFMLGIDRDFETAPLVDKTISRIYRDVRFSKDKSPYRSNMWLSFKKQVPDWKDSPVFFFELMPESYRYGMGFYQAESGTMANFRSHIDKHPDVFLKAISFFRSENPFELMGEDYKKILDKTKTPEIQKWYQKKNFYIVSIRKFDETLFSGELVKVLIKGFSLLIPLYQYLWKIKGIGNP